MANIHNQFTKFHDNIKLGRFEEEDILREKRNAVLKKLKAGLKANFEALGKAVPTYTPIDQGSYAMGTGIKPLDGDYDIDVGILFDVSKDEYDPIEVKTWVYDAVDEHTDHVELKTSCVTVQYQNDGEPIYHVDLGVFSNGTSNADSRSYLAKGRTGALPENKYWKESDPKLLEDTLMNQFSGEDKKQFIRCIRYLKRWKDKNFASATANGKPSGIALTVAAYNWFAACYTYAPLVLTRQDNDLEAMRRLTSAIQNNFSQTWDAEVGGYYSRLTTRLPISPYDDLLSKMSRAQMETFKAKIDALLNALESAASEVDPVTASEALVKVFGDDFPVPDKSSTAVKRSPAVIGSTSAA